MAVKQPVGPPLRDIADFGDRQFQIIHYKRNRLTMEIPPEMASPYQA